MAQIGLMAHQAQPPPRARLQQQPRIASRGQAGLHLETGGQASTHPQLRGLHRPPQGTAQKLITVELQPMELLRHRRGAADPLGREGPASIRSVGVALLGQAMAPKQQFALSQNRAAP